MPRRKFNLEVPAEFCEAVDRLAERYGAKWLAYSAGMLLLLRASEAEQRAAIRQVQDAEWDGGDYSALVKEALATAAGGDEPPELDGVAEEEWPKTNNRGGPTHGPKSGRGGGPAARRTGPKGKGPSTGQ